jgi:hypothetical protein
MAPKWWTLLAACSGLLILLTDITIVNVALPSITKDLDASFSDADLSGRHRSRPAAKDAGGIPCRVVLQP